MNQKISRVKIGAQDESMAMAARRAFEEQTDQETRGKWLSLPFTDCDGLPKTGQECVLKGLLAATVVVPRNTSLALEMIVDSS